jgi:phenylalanyl-tRNA synthetase alpha chain
MIDKIRCYGEEALREISSSSTVETVENLRIQYLGKKGKLTGILRSLGSLEPEQRRSVGKEINILKQKVEAAIEAQKAALNTGEKRSSFDYTLPGLTHRIGTLHPITQTIHEISDIFIRLGFEIVDGREVETEKYNFTALNIPLDHSSRDAFDTFYTADGNLLRSQTSTVQIHVMENRKPPLSIIAPGKVYRPDTVDASHSFMFHQIEGLMVGSHITFGDLKGILHLFLREYFGEGSNMRFRPHFFPFTEPSVEVDVSCFKCQGSGCSTCSQQGWLEVLGAGSVDPCVLASVGYDPDQYQGFAFGLGVERMCMLKNGIHDIRFFYENNQRFLDQF